MMALITGFVLLGALRADRDAGGDRRRRALDVRRALRRRRLRARAQGLFLLVGYVVVLLSQTELEEGGYYQGEYYVLLLSACSAW